MNIALKIIINLMDHLALLPRKSKNKKVSDFTQPYIKMKLEASINIAVYLQIFYCAACVCTELAHSLLYFSSPALT